MLTTFYNALQSDRTDPDSTPEFSDVALQAGTDETPRFNAATNGPISVSWKNTGDHPIDVQVLGSNDKDETDDDNWFPVCDDTIPPGVARHLVIDRALWAYYRFQHRDAESGAHGKSQLRGAHQRL